MALRQKHIVKNAVFLRPMLELYPVRLPSVYLIAEGLMAAVEQLSDHLIILPGGIMPTRHQKQELACADAMKIRRLCSFVRARKRHNDGSHDKVMDELKKCVERRSPASTTSASDTLDWNAEGGCMLAKHLEKFFTGRRER